MSEKSSKFLRAIAAPVVALIGYFAFKLFEEPSPAPLDLGAWLGLTIGLIVLVGPMAYVHISGLKIKNPRPLFVEPGPLVAFGLWLLSIVVIFMAAFAMLIIVVMILMLIDPHFTGFDDQPYKETFVGNLIILFLIITTPFAPIVGYVIFIKMRYKKIIEYNTPEWKAVKARKRKN